MRKISFYVSITALTLSVLSLIGCGDGPSASTDQMAASRDKQAKALDSQRAQRAAMRGQGSIDAAAKAGQKAGAGN